MGIQPQNENSSQAVPVKIPEAAQFLPNLATLAPASGQFCEARPDIPQGKPFFFLLKSSRVGFFLPKALISIKPFRAHCLSLPPPGLYLGYF